VNDGYVNVTWTRSGDTSIAGYNVYCQNLGKDAEAAKMQDTADTSSNVVDSGNLAGQCGDSIFNNANVFTTMPVSTTTTTTDSATSDALADDSGLTTTATTFAGISDLPLSLLCASPNEDVDGAMTSGATASGATINLTNYDYYVFTVAAVDELGNVGPIGALACGTPAPLADFWYDYTTEGGLAGGGYCALEAVGTPGGSVVMGLGMAFAGAGFLRRRKRRSRAAGL
jgi:hypothetical protein